MKDGRTRLADKPEHAVDLDTGAILAAPVHPGDAGDTTTLEATLAMAAANLATVDLAPVPEAPAEVVGDKGYHARELLKRLDDRPWRTRIAEPTRKTVLRWHGDLDARRAVYANRARLLSGVARIALVLRAVFVRAGVRARSRSRWHASHLASRAGERRQARPGSDRRSQPRAGDAGSGRRRHPAGGRRPPAPVARGGRSPPRLARWLAQRSRRPSPSLRSRPTIRLYQQAANARLVCLASKSPLTGVVGDAAPWSAGIALTSSRRMRRDGQG